MKLKEVRIENFRQYFGKQSPLFFARTKDKNVTLIYGVNGAGKSNLFKAINWCIYGATALDDKADVLNKEALHQLGIGDSTNVRVMVKFTHRGEEFQLSRVLEILKEADDQVRHGAEEFTMMKIKDDGRSERVGNPTGQMNAILSENVRTYFLFDGEKIDNFSKPESADDVKNAIYNVLKLEVLERGKKHLSDVAEEYRQDLKRIADVELQGLIDKYEEKYDEKKKIETEQDELDQEIKSARSKIQEIDSILEGMKESKELQTHRKKLEEERKEKRDELDSVIEDIRNISTSTLSSINLDSIEGALELLDSKRVKGEIPSIIRNQFLEDILERKKCICGTKFKEDSIEAEKLKSLQKQTVSGAVEEEVIRLTGSLRGIESETEIKMNELNNKMRERSKIIERLEELENEIDEISRKLRGSRTEDVEKLEEQRENFLSDIDNNNIQIGENKSRLKKLSDELGEISEEISRAESEVEMEKELKKKMAITQRASDAISGIYQQFADDMRKKIEEKTKQVFDKLIWKESQFKKISLNKDYQLEIYDRWNSPASRELSAGERQILSLSFIISMARESGEEAPLVMDTPFGRLSSSHRAKITKNVPELANQLVLFITDEEMNEEMASNIMPSVGETYHLRFDDNTGCTTIEREHV